MPEQRTAKSSPPDLFQLARDSLRDLIRIDTSNPPGGELRAAEYLAASLAPEGVSCQIFEPVAGRGNLVARLAAQSPPRDAPLILLAHLDCVPFDPAGWDHGPLDADVAEGAIWGRGAVNCKGSLAVWAAILAGLSRVDATRRRDVVLVATADALTGWEWGMGWMMSHHPDCLAGDVALAHGGGWPVQVFGKTYYTYQCSEKGIAQARLVAHSAAARGGATGPAGVGDAAGQLFLLGRALSILERLDLPIHVTPCFQAFVEALAAPQQLPASSHIRSLLSPLLAGEAVSRVTADPRERSLLLALARNTAVPARVNGGPGAAAAATGCPEIVMDCRLLPGQTSAGLCAELRAALAEEGVPLVDTGDQGGGLEVVVEEILSPTESPPVADIVTLMGQAITRRQPGAYLVPLMSANPTGSRFARMLGTPAYGFFPTLPEVDLSGARGANERLPLASLQFAVDVLWDVVAGYVTYPGAPA